MPDEFENNDCTFGEDTGSSEACATCDVYEQCHAAFIGEGTVEIPRQTLYRLYHSERTASLPEDRVMRFSLPFRNIAGGQHLQYDHRTSFTLPVAATPEEAEPNHRITLIPQNPQGPTPVFLHHHRSADGGVTAPCSHANCPICEAGHHPRTVTFDYETLTNPTIAVVHEAPSDESNISPAVLRQAMDRIERRTAERLSVEGIFSSNAVRNYVDGTLADVGVYDRVLEPSEIESMEAHLRERVTPVIRDVAVACKELISDCLMEGIYTKHELVERIRREFPEFCSNAINDDQICRLVSDMTASDVTFEGRKIITLSDGALLFEGICPQGLKFGLDVDNLAECETCEVYSTCAQRAIEIVHE